MGATRRPGNRRILASLSAAAVLAAGAAEAQVPQPIITKVVTADTQLLVYWDGPGSEQLLRYELGIRAGSGEWDDSHLADFGNHRFVGLENGTTYTIRVRSVFPSGTSDWTTSNPVTPAAPSQPPGQVTLRGLRVGPAAADLLFRGVDHAARYTVEWLPEEQWMAEMETWTSAQQRSLGVLITFGVTIGGLRPGTTYRARIRAENSVGNGPWNEFSFTTSAAPPPPPPPPPDDGVRPPAPPRNLQATGEDRAASLTWRAPVDDGGARIVRYEYRLRNGDGPYAAWQIIRDRRGEESHVRTRRHRVNSLTNGMPYTFEVRAVNIRWASQPSEAASATPMESQPVPALPLVGQVLLAMLLTAAGAWRRTGVESGGAGAVSGRAPRRLCRPWRRPRRALS